MQVFGLVGATPTHGPTFDLDGDILGLVGALGNVFEIGIVEAQMDRMGVEGGASGLFVQRGQQRLRGDDGRLRSGHPEDIAAVADFDAKLEFDLAQMRIERAGEIGEALGVLGFQGEVAMC